MAPSSAYRLSTMIWSCILLISLLVATAGSTTVTKTHITTTQITVNEQHGLHAMASAPESPGPIASYESLEEENPPNVNLDLNKRAAQNAASTATNLGVTYTVGTHLIPFTGGETKSIDGTLYSLDTGSHSLYFLLPISPTSSGSAGAGGASGSSSGSSMTLVSTATPTETLGQTAVGVPTSGSSSSTGASSSGSQSKSSTASVNPTMTTAEISKSTSVKGTTSDTSSKSSSGSSSQGPSLTSSSSLVGQTIGTNQTAASMTSDTTSSKLPSGSSSQGTSPTSLSSLGQSIGTNRTATTSTTSSSVSHSDTSTHTSNSSGLSASSSSSATSSSKSSSTSSTIFSPKPPSVSSSVSSSKVIPGETSQSISGSNQTVASSTSISNTRGTSMIGTQSTSLNNSTVSLSTSSSASASDTQITTSTSALNKTSSISSTKLSTSNTALINSTTTGINTTSSRSSTTSGVTVSTSSRSGGNQTTPTGSKPSTLVNGTSTSTVSRTRSSQSSAQVVTTFVSTITAVNISDASGSQSQTSTKVVTTVVSTLTGLSTGSTDASSSDTLSLTGSTTSDEDPMSGSSTDDASSLITPMPLSTTASDEPLQEVTLMTGHWDEEVMEMSCKPPCTMTLPAVPLNTPATLRYPPAITSVCTNVGSQIYRYAVTVSVDPVTITELALLPVSVGAMTGQQPAVTSEINFSLPQGSCSMALPSGDVCAKRPMDSTNGTCGPQVGLGCPDMQCCGPQGTCGTGSSECAIANGCNHDFGPCWLPGENSFRPLSEVFAPATETSACPIALLPGPSDGTEIAQPPDTTDSVLPPPEQTSTDGQTVPVPIPVPTPRPGGPPKPPKPRLCFLCGKIKLPKWKLDLSCRGPLCKHIGPRRGCLGICDLFKCHVGCGKKGGGDISKTDKPKPDPEDPPGPGPDPDDDEPEETETVSTSASSTQSSSSSSETESECETTMTATQVTAMCNIFTEVVGINMGNDTTLSAPQTTCTSTKRRITQGCEVTGTTTTVFDSCTKTQTATEITKFCTESISAGVTYTPCTRTASTVFEGCSVTATTTSVIDDVCQAQVTLAPDDPQGEFGTLPANSSNETCPYFPGVKVTVLDDQGADGQSNDTCPMPNGTRTSFDDDQGDDEPKSSCNLNNSTTLDSAPSCPLSNATLIQGPDGAEDGNVTASCPINSTIVYEPDGALDSDSAPLCNITSSDFNMTMEQELGQGEDGLKSNQSCPMKGNSTLEVDNDQGEDGPPTEEDSCPIIPDGIVLSPLADLGDYASNNETDECPALDGRFPISWMDEQGDDYEPPPPINSTTSTSQSKTSLKADCHAPKVDNLGRCTLVMFKTVATKNAPVTSSSWSCTCASQTSGQEVKVITRCDKPACPNFEASTTMTSTVIDTRPLFTFNDPSLSPTPSAPPGQGSPHDPARCSCTITTVSGDRTCIRPETCASSDCIWPTNTNIGRCRYLSASVLAMGRDGPSGPIPIWDIPTFVDLYPYPDIDYCVCANQANQLVNPMPGCNTEYSRVCPNQVGLVTHTWSRATPIRCLSALPSLTWFESCALATQVYTAVHRDALGSFVGDDLTKISTFCKCNKVGETRKGDSTYVLSTVRRDCDGGYLCHNSLGFITLWKSSAEKRIVHEPATTATAVGPLLAVTTEATPGSAPTMAAEPTVLMA